MSDEEIRKWSDSCDQESMRHALADYIKMRHLLSQATGHGPFICGASTAKDEMGLPDAIYVCPAYGLDGFATYKKATDYSAPGW